MNNDNNHNHNYHKNIRRNSYDNNDNRNHNNRLNNVEEKAQENIRKSGNIEEHLNFGANCIDLTNDDDGNVINISGITPMIDEDKYNKSAEYEEMKEFMEPFTIQNLFCKNAQLNYEEDKEQFQSYLSSKDMLKLKDKLLPYLDRMNDLRKSANYLTTKYISLCKLNKLQSDEIKQLRMKADKYDTIHELTQEITNCGHDQELYTSFCKDIVNDGKCKKKNCQFAHSVELCAVKDIAQDLPHHLAFLPNVAHITDDLFWYENRDLKKKVEKIKLEWMEKKHNKNKK